MAFDPVKILNAYKEKHNHLNGKSLEYFYMKE